MQDSSVLKSADINDYEVVPEGTPPDGFADYASIIGEYRRFAGYSIEGYDKASSEDIFWYSRGWLGSVIISFYIEDKRTEDDYSYAVKDLNANGSPELILAIGDHAVCAIFSMVNNRPKLLDEFWQRNQCEIDSAGIIHTHGSNGAGWSTFQSYRISQRDDELVLVDEFGTDGWDQVTGEQSYYRIVDGINQNITSSEFDELYNQFSDVFRSTKNSGIEFIPLFD
ncbi:MAG: hypothetical protein FWH57_04990 [Oscillospiraceae bacterium]|nr:hypothetical protein [Oscillospiraceae bacterium]